MRNMGEPTDRDRPGASGEAEKKKHRPFYRRIRIPSRVLIVIGAAGLVAGLATLGMQYFLHNRNPEERAVREQLYEYRFDFRDDHFSNIDKMGPSGVNLA